MFTFETVLIGWKVKVTGEFSPAEPDSELAKGWPVGFEAQEIRLVVGGERADLSQIPNKLIEDIEAQAFKASSDQVEAEQ